MNLIEKLIAIDADKFKAKETKTIKSKRLSKIMGEDAEITIRELSGKRLNNIMQIMIDKEGNKDFSRLHDVNLMYCVHGIVNPNLKDTRLMEHFGVLTPKDLAELLLDNEAANIAAEIVKLSGIDNKAEEKVKN